MPGNLLSGAFWRAFRADCSRRDTHRAISRLAIPMMLSNLTIPLVSVVDSTVAGHLDSSAQLGAVAIGSSLYTLLVWASGFLRMGATGFAAQAYGRQDNAAVRSTLLQFSLLGVILALALVGLTLSFSKPLLRAMHAADDVMPLASDYLRWRALGLPAALLNYALVGWYVGMHRAKVSLGVLLVTNLVNAALNPVLVFGLDLGIRGIAWASIAGEWCGVAFGAALLPAALRAHPAHIPFSQLRELARWLPMLAVNRDIFIRTLALEAVFFTITLVGTRLGTAMVAANALLLNGLLLTANGLDGLAQAVEAMAGKAIGARNRDALRRALSVASLWSAIGALVFALAFAAGGRWFINLQTTLPDVRAAAHDYLPYLACLPLIAVWSYLLDGLFVGATRARDMRNAMLLATAGFLASVAALHGLGNHGLWLSFMLFMVIRALSLLRYAPGIFAELPR